MAALLVALVVIRPRPNSVLFWALLLPALAAGGAQLRRSDPEDEEILRLQGTWKQIDMEKDGLKDPPDEKGWEPKTLISGNTFVVTLADGRVPIKGTFKLDPTSDPKAIDWTDTHGEDAGKTFKAIYTLEGDRFVFCAADAGQERPRGFKSGPGQVLRVNQRLA